LPLAGREIPIAGAGFMIVAAGAVLDRGIVPVIEADLQHCTPGNLCPHTDGTAFEMTDGNRGAGRIRPEVPDAVWVLADTENHRTVVFRVGQRHGIVSVGAKPRKAAIKAAPDIARVVVEYHVLPVNMTGQLRVLNFYLRMFITGNARIGDGYAPEHRGRKIGRPADRVDVTLLVANFRRNAGIGLREANNS